MKLRLRTDLVIDPLETELVNNIKTFLLNNKDKFLTVNEDMTSRVMVEKCYHDEIPLKPCELIFEWEQS